MTIIWITIFVAFCILCGFIYIFKNKGRKKREIKRHFQYLPRKKFVTIYTVECKQCNNMEMAYSTEVQPDNYLEFTDIEVKWDDEHERQKMLLESNYLKCEKHNCDKSVCRERTYSNY